MITRLTSPAFSIRAEVHVPAPLNVYRHRADLIQEFGRRNATFWVSWKVPARGRLRKRLYIPHQAAAHNWGDYLTGHYKAPEQSHSPSLVNLGAWAASGCVTVRCAAPSSGARQSDVKRRAAVPVRRQRA
jgi:hypothetical protein